VWGYEESAINEFLTELSAAVVQTRIAFVYLDGIVDTSLAARGRESPVGWTGLSTSSDSSIGRDCRLSGRSARPDPAIGRRSTVGLVVLIMPNQRLPAICWPS